MRNKVEFHLKIEKMTARIASRFINVDYDDYGSVLMKTLEDIGKITLADRVYIFEFTESQNFMSNTYEWCKKGVSKEIDNLQDLPVSIFPWWVDKVKNNEIIYIEDVSKMPKEASEEQKLLESQGIKGLIVLPLFYGEKAVGFFGIDNVHKSEIWNKNDSAILKINAKILSDFFKQKNMHERLIYKNKKLVESMKLLKSIKAEMIQKEKLSSIGQLSAGLAHEINNSLGSIRSTIDLMEDFCLEIREKYLVKLVNKNNDEKLEYLVGEIPLMFDDLKNDFKSIDSIVKSIRNLTEASHSEKKFHNLNELIEEAIVIYNTKNYSSVNFELDLKPLKEIYCQRHEIQESVNNILKNSLEAFDKNKIKNPKIHIKTYSKENYSILKVIDNAGGINNEHLNKIFEPFFTTKDIGDGYGLGLALTYDVIVNKHNGRFLVKSLPAGRTEVIIKLPEKNKF